MKCLFNKKCAEILIDDCMAEGKKVWSSIQLFSVRSLGAPYIIEYIMLHFVILPRGVVRKNTNKRFGPHVLENKWIST